MKKLHVCAVLGLGAFTVVGCGLGERFKERKNEATTRSDLAGSWKSDCAGSGTFTGKNATSTLVFDAVSDFSAKVDVYPAANCTGTEALHEDMKGSYALTGPFSEGASHPLDLSLTALTLTPDTADAARALNSTKYCGHTDWQVSVPLSLLGANCSGQPQIASGGKLYSLVEVQGNSLYLGSADLLLAPTSGAARAPSVVLGRPFHAQ